MKYKVGDIVTVKADSEIWEETHRDFYREHNKGVIVKINPNSTWYPYEIDIPTVDIEGNILRSTTIWREEELELV